jgi:predicted ATPase
MIESIEFKNFKVLRDATLPLGRCNILVGPNGSGKTTVLQALEFARDVPEKNLAKYRTIGLGENEERVVAFTLNWATSTGVAQYVVQWKERSTVQHGFLFPEETQPEFRRLAQHDVRQIRTFSFDAHAIAAPSRITGELAHDGSGLAGVLFQLREGHLEHFESVTAELSRCLPEFDRILFAGAAEGPKTLVLRTRHGHHRIHARDLAQGTLIVLALLTLANLPFPPSIVALEEPDRGIHPRLLRNVQDALYRLTHPESCELERKPVQVIATTHSPYFLDLFKDHLEEIVICERVGQEVHFNRASELPHIDEILADAPLGEAWYTGILGGVPSEP